MGERCSLRPEDEWKLVTHVHTHMRVCVCVCVYENGVCWAEKMAFKRPREDSTHKELREILDDCKQKQAR